MRGSLFRGGGPGKLRSSEVSAIMRISKVSSGSVPPRVFSGTKKGSFASSARSKGLLTTRSALLQAIGTACGSVPQKDSQRYSADGLEPPLGNLPRSSEISRTEVDCFQIDRRGSLWFGLNETGLARLSGGGEVEVFGLREGLPDDRIRALYEDREGNLWAGSYSGGLYRFKEPTVVSLATEEGLLSGMATAVLASRSGTLWSGSTIWGFGVSQTVGWKAIRPTKGFPPISSGRSGRAPRIPGVMWGGHRRRRGAFSRRVPGRASSTICTAARSARLRRSSGARSLWLALPTGLSAIKAASSRR